MLIAIIGLIIGVAFGWYLPVTYPTSYSLYMSVAILAALDTVFGGIRAYMEDTFNTNIFVSGFFGNAILAGLLAYIGDRLGVPLYYAAIFTFGGRLFNNFARARRSLIEKLGQK
ncbi:small basic protein [Marinisporobacter balticus]|uniref:Small basic protein n=1 Tax=Marinisporobacter balticus TaxID=2018667 RepID=A0A4R2L258_9FIRM|nr:small basic family protein [Marinisporobacter balticus]TCO79297.1 small basic protein [Marinisporobacter balticus]